jgi:hypothetical protein
VALVVLAVSAPTAARLVHAADPTPVAVLAAVQGKVEVVPAKGGTPQRASFGRGLAAGDKVTVGAGSTATLFFSDGNVIELAEKSSVTVGGRADQRAKMGPGAGLPGEVYANVSKFVTGGSRQSGLMATSALRGSERAPLLLSPRKTEVLETQPAFTWRAVEGATRYRLKLSGESGELWSREVTGTRLDYPADATPLAAGADYLWEIEALSDRGSLGEREDSYFRVVASDEAKRVRDDLERIATSAGGDASAAAQFLSGSYLFGRGLYRDAAAHFEKLSHISPESPAPHEALGNVYQAVGLTDQAAAAYKKALDLARTP